MSLNAKSLKQLEKIYAYKQKKSERAFNDQRLVVNKCIAELTDITETVLGLRSRLADNAAYMKLDEVSSDASKMVLAFKYKAQLDYDIERESFFLGLAQADLETAELELKVKRNLIEKYGIKIEFVSRMSKKARLAKVLLEEMSQEEDFEQTYNLRAVPNV